MTVALHRALRKATSQLEHLDTASDTDGSFRQKINQYVSISTVKHNFHSQKHCSGLLLLWRYNTMSFSDWSHCFRVKMVEQVNIISYNMQQYINALTIISSTKICAALRLSGCKHEKQ